MTLQQLTREFLSAESGTYNIVNIENSLQKDPQQAVKLIHSFKALNNTFGINLRLLFDLGLGNGVIFRKFDNKNGSLYLSIPYLLSLLPYGFDIDTFNSFGYTALHLAASTERVDIWKILIAAGADPNIKSKNSSDQGSVTPLQIASKHSEFEGVI